MDSKTLLISLCTLVSAIHNEASVRSTEPFIAHANKEYWVFQEIGHNGSVTKLCVATTEVTTEQFCIFLERSGHQMPERELILERGLQANYKQKPVTYVRFVDVIEYCNWLSQRDSCVYRLPSAVEWEQCCMKGILPGAQIAITRSLVDVEKSSKDVNGMLGMLGGVREYCDSWEGCIDPPSKAVNSLLVSVRGGHWKMTDVSDFLPSRKDWIGIDNADDFTGFRLVLEITEHLEGHTLNTPNQASETTSDPGKPDE